MFQFIISIICGQVMNEKLFYITGCFYYFSSTVNPILYNVMSVKYRKVHLQKYPGIPPPFI